MNWIYKNPPLPLSQPNGRIASMLDDMAWRRTVEILTNTPLAAPFGRCPVCGEPLDIDKDCIDCLYRQLEKSNG